MKRKLSMLLALVMILSVANIALPASAADPNFQEIVSSVGDWTATNLSAGIRALQATNGYDYTEPVYKTPADVYTTLSGEKTVGDGSTYVPFPLTPAAGVSAEAVIGQVVRFSDTYAYASKANYVGNGDADFQDYTSHTWSDVYTGDVNNWMVTAGAAPIWEAPYVVNPTKGDIVKFEQTITIDERAVIPADGVELQILADNAAVVVIDGVVVAMTDTMESPDFAIGAAIGTEADFVSKMFGDLTPNYFNWSDWAKVTSVKVPASYFAAGKEIVVTVYAADSIIHPDLNEDFASYKRTPNHTRPGDIAYNPAFVMFGMRIPLDTTTVNGDLTIAKTINGAAFSGTTEYTFTLTSTVDPLTVYSETTVSGIAVFNNLPFGTYTVAEKDPGVFTPDFGYWTAVDIYSTPTDPSDDEQVWTSLGATTTITLDSALDYLVPYTCNNKATGSLLINKLLQLPDIETNSVTGQGMDSALSNNWFEYTSLASLAANPVQTFPLIAGRDHAEGELCTADSHDNIVGSFTVTYDAVAGTVTVSYELFNGYTYEGTAWFSFKYDEGEKKGTDINKLNTVAPGQQDYSFTGNTSAAVSIAGISKTTTVRGKPVTAQVTPAIDPTAENMFIYIHLGEQHGTFASSGYTTGSSFFVKVVSVGIDPAFSTVVEVKANNQAGTLLEGLLPGTYILTEVFNSAGDQLPVEWPFIVVFDKLQYEVVANGETRATVSNMVVEEIPM